MKINATFSKGEYPDKRKVSVQLQGEREEVTELIKTISLHLKSRGYEE